MPSKAWYQCIHATPILGWCSFPYRDSEWISINFSNRPSLPHNRCIRNHPLPYQNQDPGPLDTCHSSFSRPSVVCTLLLPINIHNYQGTKELSLKALLYSKRISIETVVKNAMRFFFFNATNAVPVKLNKCLFELISDLYQSHSLPSALFLHSHFHFQAEDWHSQAGSCFAY